MVYRFTYGKDSKFPFQSGWTEVIADSLSEAVGLFNLVHPPLDPAKKTVNCAFVYDEKEWLKTAMDTLGNYGSHCVERLSLNRTLLPGVTKPQSDVSTT